MAGKIKRNNTYIPKNQKPIADIVYSWRMQTNQSKHSTNLSFNQTFLCEPSSSEARRTSNASEMFKPIGGEIKKSLW